VRGWLRALGVRGAIPSPTYSLVEHYACTLLHAIHMDAYRINEWPQNLAHALPTAALELELTYCDANGDPEGRPLTARMLTVRRGAAITDSEFHRVIGKMGA